MLSHRRAGRNIATRAPAAGRYVDAVRDPDAGHAPTLFLIVGLPGAGKTVRARALAAEHGALLMTPDAWMISLFGQSQPDGKREVVEGRLIGLAIEALCLRLSVVLDFGLWTRDERSALRSVAAAVGAGCEVVYLPVKREVQLSRVRGRWERTPGQTFPMTEADLDAWRARFEVPDALELSDPALPSPPPGDGSWFDWAARRWPSLRHSVDRAMLARLGASAEAS
jgi:predicted kinase